MNPSTSVCVVEYQHNLAMWPRRRETTISTVNICLPFKCNRYIMDVRFLVTGPLLVSSGVSCLCLAEPFVWTEVHYSLTTQRNQELFGQKHVYED